MLIMESPIHMRTNNLFPGPILAAVFAGLITVLDSKAAVLITDFSSANPMTLPYGGSTWAGPNQFQSFTIGTVQGQEVLPIGGGSPTVAGGAFRGGISLDFTGQNALELTVRLLPLNQAQMVQVLLFDADGTHAFYSFPTSQFNTVTFTSAYATFATGTISSPGSIPGLDLTAITTYQLQGNYYDPMGAQTARFQMQFDQLSAVNVVPEPTSTSLLILGILTCGLRRRRN
jgi:hypothetical protein